jgi:hypothetical protein
MFGRLASSVIVAVIVIMGFFFHFLHLLSRRLTDAVRDNFIPVADEVRQDRSKVSHSDHVDAKEHNFL